MKHVSLPCGAAVPALGQGTWQMGDDPARRPAELDALRTGIDLGLTLIDTAEMYGDGRSERLVGEAIAGRRDEVFLVSKVYPHHAAPRDMRRACEASLKRLAVDTLDLYLLHWPGSVPLEDTVHGFEALQREGKIRHWGVSNFDLDLMTQLLAVPGGDAAQTNQVLYNLGRRGIEWDLAPLMAQQRLPVMAYSPVEQGALLRHRGLVAFARAHGMTPAQAALAWLLDRDGVIAIPKASDAARVRENAAAAAITLTAAQRGELDALFPPPKRAAPLAMI